MTFPLKVLYKNRKYININGVPIAAIVSMIPRDFSEDAAL